MHTVIALYAQRYLNEGHGHMGLVHRTRVGHVYPHG